MKVQHGIALLASFLLLAVEFCDKPVEKVALLTQYVEMCRFFEKLAQARLDGGVGPVHELHRARYQRLDAVIQLLRAKAKHAADKGKGK